MSSKQDPNPKLFTLRNVARLLLNFGVRGSGIIEYVFKTLSPESPNGDRETWQDFLWFTTSLTSQIQQGVIFSALTDLELFKDKGSHGSILTSDDTFDLASIRQTKTIVYLMFPHSLSIILLISIVYVEYLRIWKEKKEKAKKPQ